MHNTYTSEELNELVVKTFEKVANEGNKSVERIKHFIFDHGNERLLRRFWELIDEELPGHDFEYLGGNPFTGLFEVTNIPPTPKFFHG